MGESICLALYALAFDTDKTAQLAHLEAARRCFKKSIKGLGKEESKADLKEYETHALLKVGGVKSNIKIPDTTQIRIFFKNRKSQSAQSFLSGRKT